MCVKIFGQRGRGIRVGLLSNCWCGSHLRVLLYVLLDPVVISEDVGLRKPDAAMFDLTVARVGMAADQALFVDDAEPNVIGGRAAGLEAFHHHDPESTRMAIARLVDVPTSSETTGVAHV